MECVEVLLCGLDRGAQVEELLGGGDAECAAALGAVLLVDLAAEGRGQPTDAAEREDGDEGADNDGGDPEDRVAEQAAAFFEHGVSPCVVDGAPAAGPVASRRRADRVRRSRARRRRGGGRTDRKSTL